MILTADWHLTDAPADAYRWLIFDHLTMMVRDAGVDHIVILGDITDRKDRHSAKLVNMMVEQLIALRDCNPQDGPCRIDIIMGNHDKPLQGAPFWSFLANLDYISFYTEPTFVDAHGWLLLMLPFADDPAALWSTLPLTTKNLRGIFMHQTVAGVVENGYTATGTKMPKWPLGVPVFSGDIHTHQKVGRVQYVGAPHPIDFGDSYECRVLSWTPGGELMPIILNSTTKHMLDISSVSELDELPIRRGDQARIRFQVSLDRMEQWPADREALLAWASKHGLTLASVEAIVLTAPDAVAGADGPADAPDLYTDPRSVLAAYATQSDVPPALHDAGQALLKETIELWKSQ